MNGDSSTQRYVSTFRMYIKKPGASPAPGATDTPDNVNGPGKCTCEIYLVVFVPDVTE